MEAILGKEHEKVYLSTFILSFLTKNYLCTAKNN